jgi:hypothetical protein
MSLYCAKGSVNTDLSSRQLNDLLPEVLVSLGDRKRVLAVPPDQTRKHSRAGELTRYACLYYGDRLKAVLPAIGTHAPMQPAQIARMCGDMRSLCSACVTGGPMWKRSVKFRRSLSMNNQRAS